MTDLPEDSDLSRYPKIVLWEGTESEMEFLPIPPGEFWMGSRGYDSYEEPRHRVTIPAPHGEDGKTITNLPAFWMARTPVTQVQFERWTGSDSYRQWIAESGEVRIPDEPHNNGFGPEPLLPAESLSWREADEFCTWLNTTEATSLLLDDAVRAYGLWSARATLPSEVHWEYACRAGSDTEFGLGDGDGVLREMGWFDGNSDEKTHPVAQKKPNKWDLYDMHGNIWEWCLDVFCSEVGYQSRLDGDDAVRVPEDKAVNRVLRGGSWCSVLDACRSAFRGGNDPYFRLDFRGFRVCLLPGPVAQAAARGAHQPAGAAAEAGAGEGGGTPTGRALAEAEADRPLDSLILPPRPDTPPSPTR